MHTNKKKIYGFITLEVLIAFSVIILSLSAVLSLVFYSQNILLDSQLSSEAVLKARDQLGVAEAQAAQDFNLLNSADAVADGIYKKTLNVESIDYYTKKVSSNVEWEEGGRKQTVSLTTLVVNNMGYMESGTCNSTLAGDWKNPVNLNFDFAGLVGDAGGQYPITGVDAYHGKLYVTVNNSSSGKETFFIFDIVNPQTMSLISKIDNDSANNTGLNGLAVSGKYAYVASASSFSKGQLQIIDLSTVPPKIIVTYKIPGSIVSGSGTQGIGKSIYYSKGIVYLGLSKTSSGPEFNVIDVTDVYHPVWKAGANVGNGINAINVRGKYAYVASPNLKDLLVYDISPENFSQNIPALGDGFNGTNGLHGKSLALVGDTLYLGRTFGTNEFYILNAANQAAINELGHKDIGTGNNTSVNGVVIKNYLAFLLTGSQMQIWNVSNPANISQWTSAINLASPGISMDCEGDYIYAAETSSGNLGSIAEFFSKP